MQQLNVKSPDADSFLLKKFIFLYISELYYASDSLSASQIAVVKDRVKTHKAVGLR